MSHSDSSIGLKSGNPIISQRPIQNSVEIRVLRYANVDAFEILKSSWQSLEKIDEHCTPFNTWQWNFLWWKHYGGRNRLSLLVVLMGRKVVAIAPFYIHQTRMCKYLPVKVLRFIGSGMDTSPDYLNVIAAPKWREQAEIKILQYLPDVPGWNKAYFSDVRLNSTLDSAIQRYIASAKGSIIPRKPRVLFTASLPESFQLYRRALSRKHRKRINYRKNVLKRAGHHELNICANLQELEEASCALVDLHRARWKEKEASGAFLSNEYVSFHRSVIHEFFKTDNLWLITLKLDNEIVGVQYAYYWRGSLMFVQSGYSPKYLTLSPGHVMFTYAIERAIECGIEALDMLKGNYQYKTLYAKDEVYTVDQGLVRPGIRSLANSIWQWSQSKLQDTK